MGFTHFCGAGALMEDFLEKQGVIILVFYELI